ncbi:hypothetical protein [Hymenobacter persicinus]|uniref:Uncharacterized protein n=1 Tax=Hymenobacter persicinus TaxID=2025506 RepID=A0A4Q5LAP2_9BACT|nr:hypothetical protein [Hymenobacter persicinus]RYU75471.1 hypothetical protein EWM57_19835 [Hymenobacter persicinus]
MHTLLRRLLVAAVVLTTGCRSEKVAFDFSRPTPSSLTPAPALPAELPDRPAAAVVGSVVVAPRQAPAASRPARVQRAMKAPRPVSRPHLAPLRSHPETAAHAVVRRRPVDDGTEHRTLHLILGALLVVGGVVTGILLGGWLGVGVGAVVVLGGYYFLGLAFGGKHGWREVFQEFFNM